MKFLLFPLRSLLSDSLSSLSAIPDEDPEITGQQSVYNVGDVMALNCTSGRSHPPAKLEWFINDALVRVSPNWFSQFHSFFLGSPGFGIFYRRLGAIFEYRVLAFTLRTPSFLQRPNDSPLRGYCRSCSKFCTIFSPVSQSQGNFSPRFAIYFFFKFWICLFQFKPVDRTQQSRPFPGLARF